MEELTRDLRVTLEQEADPQAAAHRVVVRGRYPRTIFTTLVVSRAAWCDVNPMTPVTKGRGGSREVVTCAIGLPDRLFDQSRFGWQRNGCLDMGSAIDL